MIPRAHRLSTEQFNEVIKKGKPFHSPLFLMRMLAAAQGASRIAAAVPVKVGKTAVSRNAMRRKMYDAIQPLLPGLKEGFHVIIFAKSIPAKSSAKDAPSSKSATDAALAADLKALFVKAGIVR